MNLVRNVARAVVVTMLTLGFIFSGHAKAQPKIQPGTTQKSPVQGAIQQTPWFSPPEIRQQFKINDTQFNSLNKAYQESWTRYQKGINELDKTLTDDQRRQRMRDLQQGFYKDFSTATDTVLTDPDQRQRYNQLYWQYRGYGAFEDPMITEKLKLTAEQREKLGQFRQDWSKQMRELAPAYQTDREEAARRFTKMQSETGGRVNSVLTPDQQKIWRQMIGDPYTFQPNVYFQTNPTAPSDKK